MIKLNQMCLSIYRNTASISDNNVHFNKYLFINVQFTIEIISESKEQQDHFEAAETNSHLMKLQ